MIIYYGETGDLSTNLLALPRSFPHTNQDKVGRYPHSNKGLVCRSLPHTHNSKSHNSDDIACDIACNLMMLFADMLFVGMRYAPRGCGR